MITVQLYWNLRYVGPDAGSARSIFGMSPLLFSLPHRLFYAIKTLLPINKAVPLDSVNLFEDLESREVSSRSSSFQVYYDCNGAEIVLSICDLVSIYTFGTTLLPSLPIRGMLVSTSSSSDGDHRSIVFLVIYQTLSTSMSPE